MNIESCIPLPKFIDEPEVQPSPTRDSRVRTPAAKPKTRATSKTQPRCQYVVRIASDRIPHWVQIGLDQGVLGVERVPQLKPVAGDTVLCMLWSGEEILGELTMTWKTTGLDRVRVVAGARILNLRANQIVAVVRVPTGIRSGRR